MNRMICCTALVVLLGGGRLEASVSISSSVNIATVYANSALNASDVSYDSSVPTSGTIDLTASIETGSAVMHFSRSVTQSATFFDYSFEHVRPSSSLFCYAASITYEYFTVTDPTTTYSVSGTYRTTMTGTGYIYIVAWLKDLGGLYGPGGDLFVEVQNSLMATDQVLTMGSPEGSQYYSLSGSLTGPLERGHPYEFYYVAAILSTDQPSTSGSAEGHVSIAFVPEPSTLMIWSLLGALGITFAWWRRRKAA